MPWALDAKEGSQLMARGNQNYSRSNMRRKLAPVLARLFREERGQPPTAVLARVLGVSAGQANKYLAEDQWLSPDEIRRLADRLENFSYPEWYEHFNRAPLNYFLGRLASGNFDYRLGAIQNLPEQAIASARFEKLTPNARINLKNILRLLGEGRITYNSIGFLSRQTGIPARDIYLWSRREELEPMIEAARGER
jgi:hypothetical protein